jgi:hypothetical protein
MIVGSVYCSKSARLVHKIGIFLGPFADGVQLASVLVELAIRIPFAAVSFVPGRV